MLPVTIEKIYSQVQLQNSYIERVRKLFMQAILNRKDEKFVNPEPLREAYKIITKLPTRTKFESFLASTGCSDKLSVSETFFYMQKFMQIHPLRTTQIEFEKSIEDFYQRHQRQFLRGVKRWPKAPIQKFANFIRQSGLNVNYLQEPTEGAPVTERMAKILPRFCTRERFQLYFNTEVREKGGLFSDAEIDVVLTELDPFFTGVIQIALVQRFYAEEIKFNKQVNLNRPQEVLQEIRSIAFPAKRIALQQSLAAADEAGDGYLDKVQFVDAFYRAGVNMRRENLEFLFDVMSERFNSPDEDSHEVKADEKFLNLMFFVEKLFTRNEYREVTEVDTTLQLIKAALIYKGVDFGQVFAEQSEEQDTQKSRGKKGRGKSASRSKTPSKKNDGQVDLMCHYNRFAQQMIKEEFC